MKNIFFVIAIAAISFTACNSGTNKSNESNNANNDTTQATSQTNTDTTAATPANEIVSGYLHIKNALTNDDGNDAANGGKEIVTAIAKLDKASLNEQQKKVYDNVADDVKENAEHIGDNAGKIGHQREHFDMLSQDMYELVKAFGGGQTLYKDFCPMYNNNKGAIWLSETKEIKNPYLGKKMPTCGSVKEEIK